MRETSSRSSSRRRQVAHLAVDHVGRMAHRLARVRRACAGRPPRCRWAASGLRSSWASIARNSSLRRSLSRSFASLRSSASRLSRIWYWRRRARSARARGTGELADLRGPLQHLDVGQRAQRARHVSEAAPGAREQDDRQSRTTAAARRARQRAISSPCCPSASSASSAAPVPSAIDRSMHAKSAQLRVPRPAARSAPSISWTSVPVGASTRTRLSSASAEAVHQARRAHQRRPSLHRTPARR